MIIYLAGMFSLTRRGVCSLLGDRGIGLESQQLSPTGMGFEKTEGTLVLGLESQCICCRRKNRDHSLEAF